MYKHTTRVQLGKLSFLRFIVVGSSATLLHYLVMICLMYFSGFGAISASFIGYILSTLFNYWASSRYTFCARHSDGYSLLRFILVAVVGLGINQLLLVICINLLLPAIIAQLAATAAVMLWSYFANAIWTFSSRELK